MSDDPHSRGGPPVLVAEGARAPSDAERVRTLLAARTDGTLSTLAHGAPGVEDGHPFGSVVTFATDDHGAPLVLMSTMAEHARNLAADARCSLLVADDGDGAGRLAAARVALLGRLERVPDGGQEAATARYLAAHPGAFWARFPDFFTARLEITAARWVRGFGEMSWVEAGALAAAEPDPVVPAGARIVQHMNDDHRPALHRYVEVLLDVPGEVVDVEMLSCDRYGFEVRIDLEGDDPGMAFGRIGFDEVLDEPGAARHAMVRLSDAVGDA